MEQFDLKQYVQKDDNQLEYVKTILHAVPHKMCEQMMNKARQARTEIAGTCFQIEPSKKVTRLLDVVRS